MPTVFFDRDIRAVHFVGCSGTADLSHVSLDRPLPAYSFAAIEAELF